MRKLNYSHLEDVDLMSYDINLFMEDLENETFLYLKGMTPKDAVLDTIAVMHGSEFDTEAFREILMRSLLRIYENTDIALFAKRSIPCGVNCLGI